MPRVCSDCGKRCKNSQGLIFHKAKMHKHITTTETQVAIIPEKIPVELYAHTVGKIEELVRHAAYQNDVPPRLFARGCAEYFQRAARR